MHGGCHFHERGPQFPVKIGNQTWDPQNVMKMWALVHDSP